MFSQAKIGDRVWSNRNGWGGVKEISKDDKQIFVDFDNGCSCWFYFDGRYMNNDLYPELFWDEIQITPPPKPKKMVKKELQGWIGMVGFEEHIQYIAFHKDESKGLRKATLSFEVEE